RHGADHLCPDRPEDRRQDGPKARGAGRNPSRQRAPMIALLGRRRAVQVAAAFAASLAVAIVLGWHAGEASIAAAAAGAPALWELPPVNGRDPVRDAAILKERH